jgi:hypothetical protein
MTTTFNAYITAVLVLAGYGLPVARSSAATCPMGSLQELIDLGSSGCNIGTDYHVYDFIYLTSGSFASAVTPSDVEIMLTSGRESSPALLFISNWIAAGLEISQARIIYSLDVLNHVGLEFSGISVTAEGNRQNSEAVSSVSGIVCIGGELNIRSQDVGEFETAGCVYGIESSAEAGLDVNSDRSSVSAEFNPMADRIDVLNSITLFGDAAIMGVTNQYSLEAPEPSTFGIGLVLTFLVLWWPRLLVGKDDLVVPVPTRIASAGTRVIWKSGKATGVRIRVRLSFLKPFTVVYRWR